MTIAGPAVVLPPEGQAVLVRFDDREVTVWWGTDGDVDRMGTSAGRVMTWPTAETCRDSARRAGWTATGTDDTADPSAVDCRPAQAWLRDPRAGLDCVSALDTWNLQWDVVASRTGAYPVLTRTQARCHSELTMAAVPWSTGAAGYRPRWTAAELRCVRAALNGAIHALRTSLCIPGSWTPP